MPDVTPTPDNAGQSVETLNQAPPPQAAPVDVEDNDDDLDLEGAESKRGNVTMTFDEYQKALKKKGIKSVDVILKKLGYKDVTEALADITALRGLKAAQGDIVSKLKTAEETLAQIEADKKAGAVRDGILAAAEKATATQPRKVLAWIREFKPDEYTKILKEDGTFDAALVDQLIKDCMADDKSLFRSSNGPGSPSVRSDAKPSDVTAEKRKEKEAALKAHTSF